MTLPNSSLSRQKCHDRRRPGGASVTPRDTPFPPGGLRTSRPFAVPLRTLSRGRNGASECHAFAFSVAGEVELFFVFQGYHPSVAGGVSFFLSFLRVLSFYYCIVLVLFLLILLKQIRDPHQPRGLVSPVLTPDNGCPPR